MSLVADFKKFVMRGNILDMAVGFTVGAAFGTIAKSFVNDVIMPPIGLLLGGVDFSDFYIVLKPGPEIAGPYTTLEAATEAGAVTLNYGNFINNVLTFLVVALAVFVLIRLYNKAEEELEEIYGEKPAPGEPSDKKCPFCLSLIPFKAKRCAHCTSDLEPSAG